MFTASLPGHLPILLLVAFLTVGTMACAADGSETNTSIVATPDGLTTPVPAAIDPGTSGLPHFELTINGRPWKADEWSVLALSTDDGRFYSLVLEAARSAMDRDSDNRGWTIRFYLEVPVARVGQLKGNYTIAPDSREAKAYFSHDEQETLDVNGTLNVDGSVVRETNEGLEIPMLQGRFQLQTKEGKKLNGNFIIKQ